MSAPGVTTLEGFFLSLSFFFILFSSRPSRVYTRWRVICVFCEEGGYECIS